MSSDQVLDSDLLWRVEYQEVLHQHLLGDNGPLVWSPTIFFIISPGSSPSGIRATSASTDPCLWCRECHWPTFCSQTSLSGWSFFRHLLPIFLPALSGWSRPLWPLHPPGHPHPLVFTTCLQHLWSSLEPELHPLPAHRCRLCMRPDWTRLPRVPARHFHHSPGTPPLHQALIQVFLWEKHSQWVTKASFCCSLWLQ